jgi:benzil reductase ((S)-benzoin forming)
MHLFIVTGSSRGLGAALAQQLTQAGHTVIGLARRAHPSLAIEQWTLDLADPLPAAERLQAWLRANPAWQSATLINNAALLSEPGPLAATELPVLSASLRVGLEAPALLSRVFLAETAGVPVRRILNISSGLGRRAMAGSAAYCAVKAGPPQPRAGAGGARRRRRILGAGRHRHRHASPVARRRPCPLPGAVALPGFEG